MKGKYLVIIILSIVFALALSGCWHEAYEFYHFPDGTGRVVIRSEITRDILALDDYDELSSMEQVRDELHEYISREGEYSSADPNIAAVSYEEYIDPATDSLFYVTDINVVNMLESLFYEADTGEGFNITANPDGTYRFSFVIEATDDGFFPGQDSLSPNGAQREIFESASFSFVLHVAEFIEGDPQAVYDPAEKTVTWVFPLSDIYSPETRQELWADYRIEAQEVEVIEEEPEIVVSEPEPPVVADEPDAPDVPAPTPVDVTLEQDSGFLGLPNWVPLVLGGLFCLTLIVVVVVVVVFVILKKRK